MFSTIKANKGLIIFLLILLLGSFIRLYDPTFRSLWGDEAHSIYSVLSKFNVASLAQDSHLPSYFAILYLWIKTVGSGEYGMRLLSVIIGIVSIIAMYLFAKETFNERVALICALLISFSPLAVMHSHEIRVYGLSLLLSILSAWFFFKLLFRRITPITSLGFVIFTVLLGLTHLYSSLLILSQFAVCASLYMRKKGKDLRLIFGLLFIISMIIFPLYYKIIVHAAAAVIAGAPDMAFSSFPAILKLPLIFFVLALGETIAPWNIIVVPTMLLVGTLFIILFKRSQDENIFSSLILLVMPVLLASFLPSTMPKYLIFVLPFYIVLLGISLSNIKKPIIFNASLILLLAFQSISIANYYSFNEYHNSNQIEPWRKVSRLIIKDHKKGDLVVATNKHISYNILNYYLPKDISIVSLITEKGYMEPDGLVAKRIWLVTNIVDERVFPEGYIDGIKFDLEKKYKLRNIEKFVPYSSTLVSKLPLNRHKIGSYRITVSLYEKIR